MEPGINRVFFWPDTRYANYFKELCKNIDTITGNYFRLIGNCFRITGKTRELPNTASSIGRKFRELAGYDSFVAKSGPSPTGAATRDARC
jgi:hypothetical protein